MALPRTLLQLLVLILGFSYLIIGLNAIPITRTKNLMHGNLASIKSSIKSLPENREKIIQGRMGVELEDYPGSGANDRHTPRAAQLFGRGCVDC